MKICFKAFHTNVMTHTEMKPYSCNTCEKKYSDNRNLFRHIEIYTDETIYSSELCQKYYNYTSSLTILFRFCYFKDFLSILSSLLLFVMTTEHELFAGLCYLAYQWFMLFTTYIYCQPFLKSVNKNIKLSHLHLTYFDILYS